jgi:predicted Zn-dependent peptidase
VRTEEPSPEYYRRTISQNFKPPYVEKRVLGRAATNPAVTIMFHVPPLWHDDLPALAMLGRVMSARTGKMYMDLVEKQQHVTGVNASASNSMYDGSFRVSATGREVEGALAVPLDQDAKTAPADA